MNRGTVYGLLCRSPEHVDGPATPRSWCPLSHAVAPSPRAGLILLAGLIVVGTGAAMTHATMSPAPELEDAGRGRGGWEGASLDGGGHAGGDAGF